MRALTHTPAEIFGNQIRYVVPLFQRPYVWKPEAQWQPLWEDVEALAERILETPAVYGAPPVPPHFLGAIVIEQALAAVSLIGVRHVIDGQQRLTTLQLLLDAAQSVVEQYGTQPDSQALHVLVLNNEAMAQQPDHVFKVWPTDRDQAAFRAAMRNDVVVPPDLAGSRIAQAHAFFLDRIRDWAEVSGDSDKAAVRLSALVRALRDHLKLVVIDLEPGDNAQVIFETLNHRGTPLLAADLVKNLVFQVVAAQGHDVEDLYRTHWRELDSDYWRGEVRQGRLRRPRIDVFLNRWVTMKLLREVSSDRIFSDLRDQIVLPGTTDIRGVIADIASDARVHASMESLPASARAGLFYYRVLQAMDTQVVGPVLLWLLRQGDQMPQEQRDKALGAIESWFVRRALVRATSKRYNIVMLDLLRELVEAGPAVAGDTAIRFLSSSAADSSYWPDDNRLRAALMDDPIYMTQSRPRLRMLLEAVEDALRAQLLGEGSSCPRNLTIEHIMPRAWREHWGSDIAKNEVAGLRRDRLVHTLGNLTLVGGRLNPTMSNRPWTDAETRDRHLADAGKRSYLLGHSELRLNSQLVQEHPEAWTEDDIRARTGTLIDRIVALWPCPAGASQPALSASTASAAEEKNVAAAVGKYERLGTWLRSQELDEVRLRFAQVEEIVGCALPSSCADERHWRSYSGSAVTRAIMDAGWRTIEVDTAERQVTLARATEDDDPRLVPWGAEYDDADAARVVWSQLRPAARRLFAALIEVAPDSLTAPELARRIGVNGPRGVAGAVWRPGDLCTSVGRQWAVEWLPPVNGVSSYRIREGAVEAFRPLIEPGADDAT